MPWDRWPEARVEVYGSSASLFALRGADADATMIITGTTSGEAYVAEADRWDIVDEENDRCVTRAYRSHAQINDTVSTHRLST